jgi:hypothetical protein
MWQLMVGGLSMFYVGFPGEGVQQFGQSYKTTLNRLLQKVLSSSCEEMQAQVSIL